MANIMEFTIVKNYPVERQYFIKKPLHKSFLVTVKEWVIGGKKHNRE